MEEDLELERQRLLPFLNYFKFASGALDNDENLRQHVEETITSDIDWEENAFDDGEHYIEDNNPDWYNLKVLDITYAKNREE